MKNNELKIAPTFGAQQEKKMYATESIVQQYEDILDFYLYGMMHTGLRCISVKDRRRMGSPCPNI
jgi:hypothetical protein